MRPYTTFLCTKFHDNPFLLYSNFLTPLQKKKNKETKPILGSSYLENSWHNLVKIWIVGYWRWWASPQQKLPSFSCKQLKVTHARKMHYCSSCQYTHGCGTPASWATRHTTVCLDLTTVVCMILHYSSLSQYFFYCAYSS